MRKLIALLAAAAGSAPAGAAYAQGSGPAPGGQAPDVTVRAPERMVCRNVTRTATRMRSSRVCRPVSQLRGEDGQNQDERLAEAADRLDVLGADDLSTNCIGNPLDRTPDTPLGPR